MATTEHSVGFSPRAAATGDEVKLSMQRLFLRGRVLPVGARLFVLHTFQSSEQKPVEVIYAFALPRDAALRRFRVAGDGFAVRSELRKTDDAVREYERGLDRGSLSTLARTYGDGIVNLTLGNLRPDEIVTVTLEILCGVEVHDDGFRFRFPFTLAPGYHAKARAVETAPGEGEMELPDEEFGDLILPRFVKDATSLHQVGFDLSVTSFGDIKETLSPSHAITVDENDRSPSRASRRRVRLAAAADVPDRDLVLEMRTGDKAAGVLSGRDSDGRARFAAVAPSSLFGDAPTAPRRVVFVLDRSGSMQGLPMEQARRACAACLGALSNDDRFGIVAFDDHVEAFRPSLSDGGRESRRAAREFLDRVDARGGTELASAVSAAARMLRGDKGDLIVLTDGQVMGTDAILRQVRSAGVRIHTLGIGGASQDRFLALLSRETGGIGRFVTPRERVDLEAVELFASIAAPVAAKLRASVEGLGDAPIEPAAPDTVFAGTPVTVYGSAAGTVPPATAGSLVFEWESAGAQQRASLPIEIDDHRGLGETLFLLQGARLITDMEARVADDSAGAAAGKREAQRVVKRLEELSFTYKLASRCAALVAVVERPGDRPGDIPKTVVVPVGMPQDTPFDAYFGAMRATRGAGAYDMTLMACAPGPPPPASMRRASAPGIFARLRSPFQKAATRDTMTQFDAAREPDPPGPSKPDPETVLMDLASRLEPDGGLPGRNADERVLASVVGLLCFLSQGHGAGTGPFRAHVARLIKFLESAPVPEPRRALIREIIEAAKRAKTLPGKWIEVAQAGDFKPNLWDDVDRAVCHTKRPPSCD